MSIRKSIVPLGPQVWLAIESLACLCAVACGREAAGERWASTELELVLCADAGVGHAGGGFGGSGGAGGSSGEAGSGGEQGGGGAPSTIRVPNGVFLNSVVLAGSSEVQIGDRAQVVSGSISSFPGGSIAIGDDAVVNNLYSEHDVLVGRDATILGFVHLAGELALGPGASVDPSAVTSYPTLGPEQGYEIDVTFPPLAGSYSVATGESLTLEPGGYVNIDVNDTLHLSAGSYYFESFHAASGSTIEVDHADGGVALFVSQSLSLAGAIGVASGASQPEFLVVYLGTAPLNITLPISLFLVAPGAQLNLLGNGAYDGAAFADRIFLGNGLAMQFRPLELGHFFAGSSSQP